jgi:hypothetical protein
MHYSVNKREHKEDLTMADLQNVVTGNSLTMEFVRTACDLR